MAGDCLPKRPLITGVLRSLWAVVVGLIVWSIAMFIGDHGPRGLARLVSRMLTASRKKH